MKIAIGLPTGYGVIKADTTACLMRLVDYANKKVEVITASGTVEQARNLIVDQFLETDYTHLLFVDYDATFPVHSISELAEADKDIIGCNAANKRTGNPVIENNAKGEPLNYVKYDMEETGLIGMHVTMIKREVFESMPWPWFIPAIVDGRREMAGEDYYFCKNATKAGFEVWVHNKLSIEVGHIAEQTLTLYPHIKKQLEEAKRELYKNELQKLKDSL